MQCTVCSQAVGPGAAPFQCAICARTALYPLRIKLATTLLESEKFSMHIEGVVAPSPATAGQALSLSGGLLLDVNESAKKAAHERAVEAAGELRERARIADEAASRLRERLRELREVVKKGKGELDERRSVVGRAKERLNERREQWVEGKDRAMMRAEKSWAFVHARTAQGRVDLCREAADLAGLRHRKRKGKDGTMRDEYVIGYNPAPDLRELNSLTPIQISASLVNTARLLILISNYLNVRLPAEVTLPQKNYPQPTIFHPSASYTRRDPTFVGGNGNSNNTGSQSRTNSNRDGIGEIYSQDGTTPTTLAPKAAAVERRARPRPLYADRRLPALAREEPAMYTLFVEGVTLLAWNVAWLCHVQGMVTSFTTWEDLCPLGRNLHELLVVRLRDVSMQPDTDNNNRSVAGNASGASPVSSPLASFGQFSHGTARCFLGAAEGQSRVRAWKWQSQLRLLLDKVRTNLVAEMQGAEWEMLESKEWSEAPGKVDEEPVVVGRGAGGGGATRGSTLASGIMKSRMRNEAERTKASAVDSVGALSPARTAATNVTGNPGNSGNGHGKVVVVAAAAGNADAADDKVAVGRESSTTRKLNIDSDPHSKRAPSLTRKRTGSAAAGDMGSNSNSNSSSGNNNKVVSADHSNANHDTVTAGAARRNSASRGVNGWTKLKSRSGEPT